LGKLAEKTVKNSIYSVLEFGWPILLAILVTPFIVKKLGVDAYGVWALVSVVLGFFALLDLGIGTAAIKYIAQGYGEKDFEGINKIINSTLFVFFIIGSAGAVIIFVLTIPLVTKILNIPKNLVNVAEFAFYLASLGFLFNMINGVFACVPKAVQKYHISTTISLIIGTLSSVLTVLLLYLGFGLKGIIVLSLAISFLSLFIYIKVDKKILPKLIIRPVFDKKTFFMLFKYGIVVLATTVSGLIVLQLDKFLIGVTLSMAMVTFYVVPGNIAFKISGLTAAMVGVVLPVSSALQGTNQTEKIKSLYFKGTKFILIIITAISVPLLVFSHRFLFYWMGSDFAKQSSVVMMLLVATYYILSLNAVPWNISYGLGKIKMNAVFFGIIAFLNIGLLLILIKPFGILGAAWAYLLSVIFIVPLNIVYIERKILYLSGLEFWKICAKIAFVGLLQGAVVFFLAKLSFNLISTLGLMALSVLFFPLIYYVLGFFKEEDRELLKISLNFLKRS
jgi:O-antigen/teichoic acid export membrane protein